ncbi:MAG: amino acid adenylation domain-containing protein [Halanaerobiales bacterium]|nr:amino acid adenylation domain-containing protein [Halanaerobiales bacterium]
MKLQKENIDAIIKLTPLQKGILYHYLKNSDSDEYCNQLVLDISGEINLECFQKAWNFVLESNEVLRTLFRWEEIREPIQISLKTPELKFEFYNLMSERDKLQVFKKIIDQDKADKFNLMEVPFRIKLCQLEQSLFKMIISNHHILYDGWSTGLILKEFFAAYQRTIEGKELIKPVKTKFREFVNCLKKRNHEEDQTFWQEYLANYEPYNLWFQNNQEKINEVQTKAFQFLSELTEEINVFVKNQGITLATLFYSSWGILLQRYTNSSDVIFGTTVSGRNENVRDIENIVGLFINTIPLRVTSNPQEQVKDLLSMVNRVLQTRGSYESTPLVDIKKYSGIKADEILFNSIMVIENYKLDQSLSTKENILSIESYKIFEQTNFDLTVSITTFENLEVSLSYKKRVFPEQIIEQITNHFKNLISNIIRLPVAEMQHIDMLNAVEKETILSNWNNTTVAYNQDLLFYELFERQAELHPERIAAIFQNDKLTYKELNHKSNQLARRLRAKGVKPESIVGIRIARSLEMIIGLLAIIKAGGAYLPLDPKNPLERSKYILNDSRACLLLSRTKEQEGFFAQEVLDLSDQNLYTGDNTDLEKTVNLTNLAYVIYTSGSTGQPKGVMVEHGSLLNYLQWRQRTYPLHEDDLILQKTPFTFDVSVWEIFLWAIVGAKVCFLVPNGEKDPEVIIDTIAFNRVTVMHFVPSMLSIFLEYVESHRNFIQLTKLSSLKSIFVSGEALTSAQVNAFNELLYTKFQTRLVNLYGPTEATIEVAYFNCSPDEKYISIPIGKPIDNLNLYIVSTHNTLQPVGLAGELCIAGAGLARGYLDQLDLTEDKFVKNPFGSGKMYKTGDLACWLLDGNIQYLGRLDFQVKIRGNRIELGEITEWLVRHEKIQEAVVLARVDGVGDKYLCAYYVPKEQVSTNELHDYLAQVLPEYMIPAYFIKLEEMPLTTNGKINRKALLETETTLKTYVEPENELQKRLITIWKEILQVKKIGITDEFFSLGGHSLKVISLVLRIQREFGLKIEIAEFDNISTVSALAEYIQTHQAGAREEIPDVVARNNYPLASAQKRLYFLQKMQPEASNYNMTEVLFADQQIDYNKLEKVFKSLIDRHESLRTSFILENDEVYQTIWPKVDFEIKVFDLQQDKLDEAIRSFVCAFDLSKAPLFRVGLGRLDDGKSIIILDIHHIISDGLSNNLLIKDFLDLYTNTELPPLTKMYKDYAVWQQHRKESLQSHKEYWLNEFALGIPALNLVTDFPRPQLQSLEGKRFRFTLNQEQVQNLNQLAIAEKTTLYTLLLSFWFILLHKLTNQDDIIVGTVTSGRTHPDFEKIVGMFVNTLPIRAKIDKFAQFSDLVHTVKSKLLVGLDHQDYQFENLIDDLHLERKMDRHPLFDQMFVMQDPDRLAFSLPEINLQRYDYERSVSKFDLTLFATLIDNRIHFELEYCTHLFKQSTIERYATYFNRIISAVTASKEISILDIDLLSSEEKRQLVHTINDTQEEFSHQHTIQELFDAQAEETPENTAILFNRDKMTYRELKDRSTQLSASLVQRGVQRGDIIGIMMDNSSEVIVSIFGILKTGAAYLPIDPTFPKARKEFMLKDCHCPLLLTQSTVKSEGLSDIAVVNVDEIDNYFSEPKEWKSKGSSEDMIYIIYTSGSTGTPKGCMLKQKGVVNYVEWAIKEYFADQQIYFPFYSSIAYDLTVTSIFTPLLSGQTINIYQNQMGAINSIINDGISNIIKVTPTHLRLLLDMDCRKSRLERIIVGGEQLTTELARKVVEKFGSNIEIYNEYGPTETVVGCMIHKFNPEQDIRTVVPIGIPAQNTQIYLLNEDLQVCPVGVVGEIYIGGVGVGAGYLNRPEINSHAFLADQFSANSEGRLYRTGDLGVYLDNGLIEYVSRKDTQVKIRGYRIEIGEIQKAILDYPGVRDVVILVKEGHQKDKFLCAYFIAEKSIEITDLKTELVDRLPDYMIPTFFIQISALPVASGGKVDLNALPEPTLSTTRVIQNPITEVETYLHSIWEQNLSISDFGITDNFFEIGGNSFLLMKIHNQIQHQYPGVKITDFFKYPTIQSLAKYISDYLYSQYLDRSHSDQKNDSHSILPAREQPEGQKEYADEGIAIIGVGIRLSQAQTLEQFYQVLKNKVDCIGYPEKERLQDILDYLNFKGVDPSTYQLTEAAFLEEIDKFDYSFFKISYKEACLMDPYQRLFMETVWSTFEDAGYTKDRLKDSRTGVYVGQPHTTEYYKRIVEIEPKMAIMAGPGNIDSIISGRISYMYDLSGPSLLVNTACSSTLTAIHLASQSIKNHECDMALVGGINILIEPIHYLDAEVPAIESSTGRARTFSDDSDGTGRGEGCIAILLKPLAKALEDRDNIHAVIKGSALNNDGRSIGVTAPNVAAQEDVIEKAWQNARLNLETIGYIEAHGTGTILGDPIEVEALTNVFQRYTDRKQFCGIGAVKTNYGHLDSAAGLIGVLKAVVCLKNKKLLPNINFTLPNQKIDFINSPLYVVEQVEEWETRKGVLRRCGVSGFGLSGTNCHLVLEEAPKQFQNEQRLRYNIMLISAKMETDLLQNIENYLGFLQVKSDLNLNDVCYTTQIGRDHFEYRVAFIIKDLFGVISSLLRLRVNLETNSAHGIYYGKCKPDGHLGVQVNQKEMTEQSEYQQIAKDYVNGAKINWHPFYRKMPGKIISLPGYAFQRKRCWVEIPVERKESQKSKPTIYEGARRDTMIDKVKANQNEIVHDLQKFVANMFAMEPADINPNLDYFELGIDSISIIQLKQEVYHLYNLEISVEKLFGEISTLNKLAEYIQEHTLTEKLADSVAVSVESELPIQRSEIQYVTDSVNVMEKSLAPVSGNNDITNLINNQLQIMSQQLQLMQKYANSHSHSHQKESVRRKPKAEKNNEDRLLQKFIVKTPPVLTTKQKQFFESFIKRYEKKTGDSKQLTQHYRHVWANGRATQGFSKQWKEITYPIISKRAKGARVWDANGNEYIDFAMGFGVNLFGYNHPAIKEAVTVQLEEGVILGSLTKLPGEVAELIAEMTGVERVAFCNSGTEAVMNLMRIARATTGKEKIAIFSGSFHGTFDGVYMMQDATNPQVQPIPLSLGTPAKMAEDIIMLDYAEEKSLKLIREYADELAAVLVEPVQSRRPDLQPKEFLHGLRQLTAELGIALIFDEIITGFRSHQGGAQAYFGVEADLVSYGKIIGGGLPIGVFAGKAKYMDRVDGGMWQYGDASTPSGFLAQTGGTFCHHPLAMASAKATLLLLKDAGNSLQETLNRRTKEMANCLNDFFAKVEFDLKVVYFGSLFIFKTNTPTLLRFLYYMLIEKGFYLWEGATCFISTEHTLDDITEFIRAIQECCVELVENECFTFRLPAKALEIEKAQLGIEETYRLITHERDRNRAAELVAQNPKIEAIYPLSPMQELILAQNINFSNTGNDNSLVRYRVCGEINLSSFKEAWRIVIKRHPILRTGFLWRRLVEPLQVVYNSVDVTFNILDLTDLHSEEQLKAYQAHITSVKSNSFNIATPPLIQFSLIKFTLQEWRFVLKYQNSLFDGWSSNLLFSEFIEIYSSLITGKKIDLADSCPYISYISWLKDQEYKETEKFWINELQGFVTDDSSKNGSTYQIRSSFDPGEYIIQMDETEVSRIKDCAREHKLTLYTLFQGAWAMLHSKLQNTEELLIGTVCSGRPESLKNSAKIVGLFSNVLPIRVQYSANMTISVFLKELQDKILKLKNYEHTTINQIAQWSQIPLKTLQEAIYTRVLVYMNYPQDSNKSDSGINIELEDEQTYVNVPFRVFIEPFDGFRLIARYDRNCFTDQAVAVVMKDYKKTLGEIIMQLQ